MMMAYLLLIKWAEFSATLASRFNETGSVYTARRWNSQFGGFTISSVHTCGFYFWRFTWSYDTCDIPYLAETWRILVNTEINNGVPSHTAAVWLICILATRRIIPKLKYATLQYMCASDICFITPPKPLFCSRGPAYIVSCSCG